MADLTQAVAESHLLAPHQDGVRKLLDSRARMQARDAADFDEAQHPRDEKGQFAYAPNEHAAVAGEWDRSWDEPRWTQQHAALLHDALQSWVGAPSDMHIHDADERAGAPIPSSGTGKIARAQAAALGWELEHRGLPNPVPLYRGVGSGGDKGDDKLRSWTEDKTTADTWSKKYGGRTATLDAGTARGLRLRDYAPDSFGEKQWVVRRSVFKTAELRTARPQRPGEPHTVIKPFDLAFDRTDPNALDWIDKHTMELSDNISETSRQRIEAALTDWYEGGSRDDATDDILAAVGDDDRAEMIARTESMIAANEGQRQGWDQAVESGLLSGNEKREWIATADQVVCDECDELDGKQTNLDGEYPDPGGDGPPLHPNCRCTEGIVG